MKCSTLEFKGIAYKKECNYLSHNIQIKLVQIQISNLSFFL